MEHFKKTLTISCLILILALVLAGILYYLGLLGAHIQLSKARFDQLPGWQQDDQSLALKSFQQSCSQILKLPPNSAFGKLPEIPPTQKWQAICLAAVKISTADQKSARQFFEQWFDPYQVKNNFNPKGLFTGYYLPLIQGNLNAAGAYTIPIYGLPNDLISVNLGLFKPELTGKKIRGRVQNQTLVPYPDRAQINNGAINGKAPVLFWTNDAVQLFFTQIQGSGLIQLPNNKTELIGYAGENGRPYTAIGKILIQKKALTKDIVSMETIQDWLHKNPQQINSILNQDASYVFFRVLKGISPVGSQQIPLTPQRSLAVDTHYIPLGAPLWLVSTVPNKNSNTNPTPYQHLLIAQDTGGAIVGIIRGDIYFGPGIDAAFMAGHMKNSGKYWILLPKL